MAGTTRAYRACQKKVMKGKGTVRAKAKRVGKVCARFKKT